MKSTVTTTRDKFLVFGAPRIEEEEIQEVVETLRSGWLGTGPRVETFQDDFRKYIGSDYAVALNSCTAALHLAMIASGIKPGDEVITTALTFCATSNAIIHVGARPVFVDVEQETMNIDPLKIEKAITPKTKAIIPVHFAGRPCNMDAITAIAKKHNLLIIEDAAHAIEAAYKGKKIGTIGDLTCFSFYVTKNMMTGEGGMITTNHKEWADKAKIYGLHGMNKDAWLRYSDQGHKTYDIDFPGFKYNMMDIQAALGIHQLKRIEENYARRSKIWKRYNEALADFPIILPAAEEPNTKHARHLYTILVDIDNTKLSRDDVQQKLFELKIGTGIHYIALHLHSYYQKTFGYEYGDFSKAEFISERTLSLPLSASMTDDDVEYVIAALTQIFS